MMKTYEDRLNETRKGKWMQIKLSRKAKVQMKYEIVEAANITEAKRSQNIVRISRTISSATREADRRTRRGKRAFVRKDGEIIVAGSH